MNFFRLISLIITNNTRALVRSGRDVLTHSMRLLKLAIAVPAVLLVIGLIADSRVIMAVSGMLSVVMLMLFVIWADIIAHIVVLKSNIAHEVWEKIPVIEREHAKRFVRWLRGITLWISLIWFYAMTFPVRENVGMFLMAMTAALLLAGIASARQWNGKLFWVAYSMWAIGAFVYCSISIASPETAERIRSAAGHQLAKMRSVHEREETLAKVENEAVKSQVEIERLLLQKKLARMEELKLAGIACKVPICKEDLEEYMSLLEDIGRIKKGTYFPRSPQQDSEEQAVLPTLPASEDDGTSGDSAATLPPPPVERVEVGPKKGKPAETAPVQDNEVYSELSKYGM